MPATYVQVAQFIFEGNSTLGQAAYNPARTCLLNGDLEKARIHYMKAREAEKKQELEDLYLPYRPKRRTKATIAIEAGLLPLAEMILKQDIQNGTPQKYAKENLGSNANAARVEWTNEAPS